MIYDVLIAKKLKLPHYTPLMRLRGRRSLSLEETSFRVCRRSNLDHLVVQSVVRHYTDWATLAPTWYATPRHIHVAEGGEWLPGLSSHLRFISFSVYSLTYYTFTRLGGGVACALATGPKGRGFEPDQDDGFLRKIKTRSTPSFGWEVKPEIPCRDILGHVKHILMYFRYW
jgi:hypothetical protein